MIFIRVNDCVAVPPSQNESEMDLVRFCLEIQSIVTGGSVRQPHRFI